MLDLLHLPPLLPSLPLLLFHFGSSFWHGRDAGRSNTLAIHFVLRTGQPVAPIRASEENQRPVADEILKSVGQNGGRSVLPAPLSRGGSDGKAVVSRARETYDVWAARTNWKLRIDGGAGACSGSEEKPAGARIADLEMKMPDGGKGED